MIGRSNANHNHIQTDIAPLSLGTAALLAVIAIAAFAGNSVIARYALADGAIAPGAYSLIRLAAGALVLLPLVLGSGKRRRQLYHQGFQPGDRQGQWRRQWRSGLLGGAALFAYVATFSWAYVILPAAAGALILFASVQATVMLTGIARGERVRGLGLAGLALSICGLVVLLAPGLAGSNMTSQMPEEIARDIRGGWLGAGLLMAVSGMAWGAYTMIGRKAGAAGQHTGRSFIVGSLLAVPLLLLDHSWPSLTGALLAGLSGAVTSGLGYVVWNKVSPALGLATLATVQLATPLVAAMGGVALLGEQITPELLGAGTLIVIGIVLTLRR